MEQQLIESALALTWKTMQDMREMTWYDEDAYWEWCPWTYYESSIEKFWWYLLSPEFIKKYSYIKNVPMNIPKAFWKAIYEYQSGDESYLIELLSKINDK